MQSELVKYLQCRGSSHIQKKKKTNLNQSFFTAGQGNGNYKVFTNETNPSYFIADYTY